MIRSLFIGIDRHLDAGVPDLTGAVRDATALWALFSDSAPGLDALLVADEHATVNRIRDELETVLIRAGAEDTVIVCFAGHGTHDHRLAAHDTNLAEYEASTVPMGDLALWFKQSPAKTVICLLDCCFSGGAPARVLEGTPVSRDLPFDQDTFAGQGRVMLTAAGLDQPAFEHPMRRHGLLTNAFIEVLGRGEGAVSLVGALNEVQERVRADAAAMHVTQTPVLFGHVEGGITIPALRPGTVYRAAFPEAKGVKVSGPLEELIAAGIPAPVVETWAHQFVGGMNELQVRAVNEFGVLEGGSLLVVAPTSAGKTFIGEMAAVRAIAEGRRVVFLLPFKALVNEKFEDFSATYGQALGMRVIRCSGDYQDQIGAFLNGKFEIAVLTFEMFLGVAVGNPFVLNRLGLVVLDEAQFIADSHRGISVELLLTYLRTVKCRGIAPQLVLLSATMGGLNHFDEWLELPSFVSDARPVPLEMGVMDRNGTLKFLNGDGQEEVKQYLSPRAIIQRRAKPSSQDVVVPLVRQLLSDRDAKEKVLIFRNNRGAAEGCAKYLADELGLSRATGLIDALPAHDPSGASGALRQALGGGTAFHNANLTRDERVLVERAFRDPNGPVYVLTATTGVAAGVNTPASTVIIVEHDFPWEETAFSVAEVKNMAGRAGRLGLRETGKAILLAESSLEREQLFRKYVMGSPEAVSSSFKERDVGTWVLRLLAQVQWIREDDLVGTIANTYGGYLRARNDPDWQNRTAERLGQLIPRMLASELLEHDGEMVRLSLLGKACGASSLRFESALRLVEIVKSAAAAAVTPDKLMALVQALPEMDEQYTPMLRRGDKESQWVRELAARQGHDTMRALQARADDFYGFYGRCKRACVLSDWIAGVPTNDIESRYSITPFNAVASGDIRSIADTTRFHLSSAHKIVLVLLPADAPPVEVMEALLIQLETGLPVRALELLRLPLVLGRGEYLALADAGILTPEDLWKLSEEQIGALLGGETAKQLEERRPVVEPKNDGEENA